MSILVVEDGQIVNGVKRHVGTGGGWVEGWGPAPYIAPDCAAVDAQRRWSDGLVPRACPLHLRIDGSLSYSNGSDPPEHTYRSDWLDLKGSFEDELNNGNVREHAFWEGLTHELAGLLAIHHCEDIVVMGQHKDTIIEWFDDMYQLYHFPYKESDQEGFEAAIGAAIIAEGLGYPGLAAEVVERLQIRDAISSGVNAPVLLQTQVPSPQLPG